MSLAEHDQESRRLPIAVLGPARDALPNGECLNAWIARRPDGATLEEIGFAFGCSVERVRQIEERALGKLRGEVPMNAGVRRKPEVSLPKLPPKAKVVREPKEKRAPRPRATEQYPIGMRIPDSRLTVAGHVREQFGVTRNGKIRLEWRTMIVCNCDCGATGREVQLANLQLGKTRSCGCLAREMASGGKKAA